MPSAESPVGFRLRPSNKRGHADHGWLKTYHSFAFADYYDPMYDGWGSLRVINEDRVAPGHGFPTHPHGRFEIWSYIVDGALGHKDSMGNVEVMQAGDVQLTYAGTGIRHSEYNERADRDVHFLQIWAVPPAGRQAGAPRYYTRRFPREQKLDRLCAIVQPATAAGASAEREAAGPAPLESPVAMYASILQEGRSVRHEFARAKGYVHLAMRSGYRTPASGAVLKVNGNYMREGDGAFLENVRGQTVEIEALSGEAEFVLFDLD